MIFVLVIPNLCPGCERCQSYKLSGSRIGGTNKRICQVSGDKLWLLGIVGTIKLSCIIVSRFYN